MDLFKHGDERGAALRMIDLINKNMAHKDAPKWIEELTSTLQASTEPGETDPEL
jgi:hypothetical protein